MEAESSRTTRNLKEPSLLDDFMQHFAKSDAEEWLDRLVRGNVPAEVGVPWDEDPVDYLIALLRQSRNPDAVQGLAKIASQLLAHWVSNYEDAEQTDEQSLQFLSTTLSILERVPAPAEAATALLVLVQKPELQGERRDGHDLHRQALRALAISAPNNLEFLLRLVFRSELTNPEYAAAAFTGLQRHTLTEALEQLPRFLGILESDSIPPHEVLWSLFWDLERDPSQARYLGATVSQMNSRDLAELDEILKTDLEVPTEFPRAWEAFEDGRATVDSSRVSPGNFNPAGPDLEQLVRYLTTRPAEIPVKRWLRIINLTAAQFPSASGDYVSPSSAPDSVINLLRTAIRKLTDSERRTLGSDYAITLVLLATLLQTSAGSEIERLANLDEAVRVYQETLKYVPAASDAWAAAQVRLGNVLLERFKVGGRDHDLDQAVTAFQQGAMAYFLVSHGSLDHLWARANLGSCLIQRFEHTRDPSYLREGTSTLRQALKEMPDASPFRTAVQNDLATALIRQYEIEGRPGALDEAIVILSAISDATPGDALLRAQRQGSLGVALFRRFERSRRQADLDRAIDAIAEAVAGPPRGTAERATYLTNLGGALRAKSEITLDPDLIDRAVDALREAAQTARPQEAPTARHNLAAALGTRYRQRGDLKDLNECIDLLEAVVRGSTKDPYLLQSARVNLGNALAKRLELTRSRGDAEAAVSNIRQALSMYPSSGPDRPRIEANLGQALHVLCSTTSDTSYLDESIETFRRSTAALRKGEADWGRVNSWLGQALLQKYRALGQLPDLDAAVEAYHGAVEAKNSDLDERTLANVGLGLTLEARYDISGQTTDLEEAQRAFRIALDSTLRIQDPLARTHLLLRIIRNVPSRAREPFVEQALISVEEVSGNDDRGRFMAALAEFRSNGKNSPGRRESPRDEVMVAALALVDLSSRPFSPSSCL